MTERTFIGKFLEDIGFFKENPEKLDVGYMPNGDLLVRDYHNHTWQGLMLTKKMQKDLVTELERMRQND